MPLTGPQMSPRLTARASLNVPLTGGADRHSDRRLRAMPDSEKTHDFSVRNDCVIKGSLFEARQERQEKMSRQAV